MSWLIGICIAMVVMQVITMVEVGCIAENIEKLIVDKELIAFIENSKEKK